MPQRRNIWYGVCVQFYPNVCEVKVFSIYAKKSDMHKKSSLPRKIYILVVLSVMNINKIIVAQVFIMLQNMDGKSQDCESQQCHRRESLLTKKKLCAGSEEFILRYMKVST